MTRCGCWCSRPSPSPPRPDGTVEACDESGPAAGGGRRGRGRGRPHLPTAVGRGGGCRPTAAGVRTWHRSGISRPNWCRCSARPARPPVSHGSCWRRRRRLPLTSAATRRTARSEAMRRPPRSSRSLGHRSLGTGGGLGMFLVDPSRAGPGLSNPQDDRAAADWLGQELGTLAASGPPAALNQTGRSLSEPDVARYWASIVALVGLRIAARRANRRQRCPRSVGPGQRRRQPDPPVRRRACWVGSGRRCQLATSTPSTPGRPGKVHVPGSIRLTRPNQNPVPLRSTP